MNRPPLLEGRQRYARSMHGWTDCLPTGDGFTHTVRIAAPGVEVELSVNAWPSPSYAIRAARARAVAGVVDRQALEGVAGLAGTAMVTGLGRRVREATGRGPGADLLLDAVLEVARLARQVACLSPGRVEQAWRDGPRGVWQLDREGWVDLPDSCFTYSDAGGALLSARTVVSAATPDLYRPCPGQSRVFERRKTAQLALEDGRLHLSNAMHDNVHGFTVLYEVDLASGRFVRAESLTPRLPYAGLCSEPQGRIRALLGETLDAGLAKRIQTLLGGVMGCAQLYDLTSDLLRLVAASRVS